MSALDAVIRRRRLVEVFGAGGCGPAGQVLTFLREPLERAPVRVETGYAGGCAGHACEY
ncbi:hypothetical protein [Pseudonocardia sp. H11422]|uniref:hypothetical protein n=1 Tax=Pseudonocardia sp. H11422 TaxID=2835866 RepID=UPI001BDBF183|nr:hypothetical protein [Pseudonocardia sp. H11422]